jgi:hypothetical protein
LLSSRRIVQLKAIYVKWAEVKESKSPLVPLYERGRPVLFLKNVFLTTLPPTEVILLSIFGGIRGRYKSLKR